MEFGEIQPLDGEQVKALLKLTEDTRNHALMLMAVVTGMRQGELFGLLWENVNLEAGAVNVQFSLEEVKGVQRLKTTKSKASRRMVKIPAVLVEALEEHRTIQMAEGNAASEYVFCDPAGGPIRKSNFLRRVWHPLRDKLKLPDVRFHDLRHTSATLLLSDGISPKVIQSRLGHSTIRLTLDRYSHVLPSMEDEAVGSFQTLLKAKESKVS